MYIMKTCCVVAMLLSAVLAQGQQGMTPCQSNFVQNFNTCVQNSQLEFNNFLFLVTNGTNGQAPENLDNFKTKACTKEKDLLKCGIEFMRTLLNSTMCGPGQGGQDQRPIIDRQFRTLIGSLDEMCAHPCRRRFIEELRQCYTDANLDPKLFLSNATMGRGAVIGTTTEQANSFCSNKEKLVSCMRQKRDDCPESPMILRAIGLDIDSLEKGVGVLCSHRDVYITSLDCFAEPSESVINCQKEMSQKTVELMITAQQQHLEEEQFLSNFCDIRLDHVSCDLEAWGKRVHKACSDAVIGLRTELECGLLPTECSSTHAQTIDLVCHHDNFKREMRPESGGTSVFATFSSIGFVFAIIASLH